MKKTTLNYKYSTTLFATVFSVVCFYSCKSFVEVDLPRHQLTKETVFQDAGTANAAVIELHAKIRGYSPNGLTTVNISRYSGLYADELEPYGSFLSGSSGEFFNANILANNSFLATFWLQSYETIFAANSILEGLQKSTSSSFKVEDKNKLRGETLFLRAFVNLFLVQLFGDIAEVKSTDYNINKTLGKTSKKDVMQYIVNDLKEAVTLLPENYTIPEKVRPNKATAIALLARAYLYNNMWAEAELSSSEIIENEVYRLEENEDIQKVFHKNSPETIWQFSSRTPGFPTNEATSFYFTQGAGPDGLTSYLVNSFATHDKRLSKWIIKAFDTNGNPYYYSQKYKNRTQGGNTDELSIQFRLAEQYLIRAESRIKLGFIEKGRSDLNKIRNRAGLAALTLEQPELLLNEVLEERQRELFLEYGHRLFDLIRMGRTDLLKQRKPNWDNHNERWPLPEKELELNPNLKPQNEGYN